MCGICGIYNFGSGAPVSRPSLESATRALAHRGPDDEGFHVDGSVGLGNRRLSIIDLPGGHQPVSNEDGAIWVTFNGEIYNYRELRKDLLSRGHRLRTESDTETIVHLYEDFGTECVKHLRGIFSFALWDKTRRRLLLVRDRLGVKPLFYRLEADRIFFASELRSLRRFASRAFESDSQAIFDFFAFRYVPAPETLYRHVKKLLPGHLLDVRPEGTELRQYWDLPGAEDTGDSLTIQEYSEQVLAKIKESVRLRLISDVPLGVFLSGGTDSSALVALMAELGHRPLRTFSVGFAEKGYDERPYAREVAQRYGAEHEEITVGPDDIREHLPRLVALRDEPVAEGTDVPLYLLSRLAAKNVKVVLAGEGGDELFAGYPKYVVERWSGWIPPLPASLLRTLARSLPYSQRRLKLALGAMASREPAERAVAWFASFNRDERQKLFSRDLLEQVDENHPAQRMGEYLDRCPHLSPLKRALYADLKLWLPDNLLLRGDHMTMAAALEERVPFLDHELVEMVARIPTRLLLPGLEAKAFLKRVLAPYFTPEFLRRRKMGFRVPIGPWFQRDLKGWVKEEILSSHFHDLGIFNTRTVETMVRDHGKGTHDFQKQLWALLNFALWKKAQAREGDDAG